MNAAESSVSSGAPSTGSLSETGAPLLSVMETPENASSNPSVKSIDILVGDAWTVEPVIGIDVFRWAWAQAGAARPTMPVPATRMRAT